MKIIALVRTALSRGGGEAAAPGMAAGLSPPAHLREIGAGREHESAGTRSTRSRRFSGLVAAARTPAGRLAGVACGVGAVVLIVLHIGLPAVIAALRTGAPLFPVILILEVAFLACTVVGMRTLYGEAASRIPGWQLVRAGLIGYAVMGLVPAGRALAEVTRAALLARWVGNKRAASAAFQMQGVALVANSAISVGATVAVLLALGPSVMALAIGLNCAVTGIVGGTLLHLARHPGVDSWIARRFAGREHGGGQDEREAEVQLPWKAVAWETLGRTMQLLQNAVLVVAVGGTFGLLPALASEAVHLVGVAVGELVPAQLGFTEANFTLSAGALGLPPSKAVAIALLAHLAQLAWVLVGSLVPLFWRPPPQPRTSAAAGSAP